MQLDYSTSYWASGFGIPDIASLATIIMQGQARIIVTARYANTQTSIPLGAAPPASPLGDIVYAAQASANYAFQDTGATPRMYNVSAFNSPMTTNSFWTNGTPAGTQSMLHPTGGYIYDATAAEVIEFAAGDLMAIANRLAGGFSLYGLTTAGGLSSPIKIDDTEKTYVQTVTDTATITRGSDQLLLTISALENGISSYLISPNGSAVWIDSYGAQNGLAINGLAMLKTVQIGGLDFAILAATNSSSLTVLRVNPMGVFFETDHVFDTLDTRFANLSAFDGFVAEGRFFIVAAGTDSGLTLFEMLPNGTLSTVQTFVLEGGAGLSAVTAITVQMMGNEAQIFMVDAGADRVLHYNLDMGNLGGRIDAAGGAATGTLADERIIGSIGNDTLVGGGGADFLHDGAGIDTVAGGAGADVFVFDRDGGADFITDFEAGVDRLDVTNWGRMYSASALVINSTATGAIVAYGSEMLTITSHNGTALTLTDADFIF